MNEAELKKYLLMHFGKDFQVREEVEGHFLVDGSKVIIDFLMYPREHMLDRGFHAGWFGVEVKSPEKNGSQKGLQVAWQAITYSQSEFNNNRPAFVLIYPPLAEFLGGQLHAYNVMCLLQKANVGYIEIDEKKAQWRIKFGANAYFYSDKGLSKTPTIATKRNVGSWK